MQDFKPQPSVNKHLPEGVSYQEYWERRYSEMNLEYASDIIDRVQKKIDETNGATYLEFVDRDVARTWLQKHTYYPEGEAKGMAEELRKSIVEANRRKLEVRGWKFDQSGKPISN